MNRQENSLDVGLYYPLKREQDNDNSNILLRRVVKAPAVTEISKGLLKQCFGILDNLIKFSI